MNATQTKILTWTHVQEAEVGDLVALPSGEILFFAGTVIDEVDGMFEVVALEFVTEGNEIIELPL